MNAKRRVWLLQQAATAALFFIFSLYIFFSSFSRENIIPHLPEKPKFPIKVYLYDLPKRFTYGEGESYWELRRCHTGSPVADVSELKYPRLWYSAEWELFADLTRPDNERIGPSVVRVSDPHEADIFFVPFFSSLSSVVGEERCRSGSGPRPEYSDGEAQEGLIRWLEEQEFWRRNSGRDHVFFCQDPEAMDRIRNRVDNSVLLLSDFEQLDPQEAQPTKDGLFYYHWNSVSGKGDVDIEKRKILLFFMGDEYGNEVKSYFEHKDPNVIVNQIWRQLQHKLPIMERIINRDNRL